MDLNKLAELREIGYTIPKTCGLCKHGVFVGSVRKTRRRAMVLIVENGTYEADTLLGLFWKVMKHRFWHLRQGHGWID